MKYLDFHSAVDSLQKCFVCGFPESRLKQCYIEEMDLLASLTLECDDEVDLIDVNKKLAKKCRCLDVCRANVCNERRSNVETSSTKKKEIFTISSIGKSYSEVRSNFLALYRQNIVEHEYAAVAQALLPYLELSHRQFLSHRYTRLYLDGSVYLTLSNRSDDIKSAYSLWGSISESNKELIGFYVKKTDGMTHEFNALTFLAIPTLEFPHH